MRIDFHCHLTPKAYLDAVERDPEKFQAALEVKDGERYIRPASYPFPVGFGPLTPGYWDPAARVEHMKTVGVDVQVLSAPTYLFYYWADPGLALEVARMTNDAFAAAARAHPGRFVGMATVPLQDVPRATVELRRAVKDLEHRAVEIGTAIAGRELDDPALFPFYECAQELDIPVFVHPNNAEGGTRTRRFYFGNVLGFPFDSTIAIAAVIFGGILERFPRLKLCFAHGGGYLPYQIGRLDHAATVRPECQGLRRRPTEYLRAMFYDSITHSHESLRWLVGLVGDDHVVLGSDFPYDMGEFLPVRFVQEAGFSPEAAQRILGLNAARLLRLPLPAA
jgi:aminocarboxymuconate-semialdehyde decarboxylase